MLVFLRISRTAGWVTPCGITKCLTLTFRGNFRNIRKKWCSAQNCVDTSIRGAIIHSMLQRNKF